MQVPSLSAGTLIGDRYRVIKPLRGGGMGVVVEAEHGRLGRRVAIKVLHPEMSKQDEVRARFEREGRITSQLQSEHVVEVLDIGELESGEMYLVMELLAGKDLDQLLEERRSVPVEEAVDYALQAAEGLAAAHAEGLVHRDIKPANLFLADRKGRPPVIKVLDFGVTKEALSDTTLTTSFFGTPQYMSPEQIRSPKHVDARTDQYSLAVVLYELISGVMPFDADGPADVAAAVLEKAAPPLATHGVRVDGTLEQVILRALSKNPADRFADLADFGEALVAFGPDSAAERGAAIFALLGREPSTVKAAPSRIEAETLQRPPQEDELPTSKIDEKRQARARAQLEASRAATKQSGKTEPIVAALPRLPAALPRAAPVPRPAAVAIPVWVYFAVAAVAALLTAAFVRWA
jgi:eukaryotic-like serine/threonine-protein kinase